MRFTLRAPGLIAFLLSRKSFAHEALWSSMEPCRCNAFFDRFNVFHLKVYYFYHSSCHSDGFCIEMLHEKARVHPWKQSIPWERERERERADDGFLAVCDHFSAEVDDTRRLMPQWGVKWINLILSSTILNNTTLFNACRLFPLDQLNPVGYCKCGSG